MSLKNTMSKEADLIIIGAGPGGYRAAEYAAKQGLKVVIFEDADVGGTCLNVGCIPTKTYVHSATFAEARERMGTPTSHWFVRKEHSSMPVRSTATPLPISSSPQAPRRSGSPSPGLTIPAWSIPQACSSSTHSPGALPSSVQVSSAWSSPASSIALAQR